MKHETFTQQPCHRHTPGRGRPPPCHQVDRCKICNLPSTACSPRNPFSLFQLGIRVVKMSQRKREREVIWAMTERKHSVFPEAYVFQLGIGKSHSRWSCHRDTPGRRRPPACHKIDDLKDKKTKKNKMTKRRPRFHRVDRCTICNLLSTSCSPRTPFCLGQLGIRLVRKPSL